MKIAILGGTGQQGPGLALRWAMAGEEVILGSRSQGRAEQVALELNAELGDARIRGMENPQAAEAAEIVVLTVPYTAHLSTLESVKAQVQGKIFVDVSVPLDPENPRRMKMPPAGSATEEAQAFFGPVRSGDQGRGGFPNDLRPFAARSPPCHRLRCARVR
jgi:8-hydroxy-5-deazaflavin:NADPH oxidoreductase